RHRHAAGGHLLLPAGGRRRPHRQGGHLGRARLAVHGRHPCAPDLSRRPHGRVSDPTTRSEGSTMHRKHSLAGAALAASAALTLAACGSAVPDGQGGGNGTSGGSDGGVIQIEVMSNFTSDIARGAVLDELIAEFNEAHEGEYEVVSTTEADWPTLQQKIRSM